MRALAAFFVLFAPAAAASQAPEPPPLGNLALALLAVAALAAGAAWLARRLSAPATGGTQWLRTVAALPIGPRERVLLLEVGSTWLLVGIAPGRVTALHAMPRPPEALHACESPRAEPAPRFALRLREQLARMRRA